MNINSHWYFPPQNECSSRSCLVLIAETMWRVGNSALHSHSIRMYFILISNFYYLSLLYSFARELSPKILQPSGRSLLSSAYVPLVCAVIYCRYRSGQMKISIAYIKTENRDNNLSFSFSISMHFLPLFELFFFLATCKQFHSSHATN